MGRAERAISARSCCPTLAKAFKFDLNAPWGEHSAAAQHALLHGAPGRVKFQTDGARGRGEYESDWEGVLRNVERRYQETDQRRGARRSSRSS